MYRAKKFLHGNVSKPCKIEVIYRKLSFPKALYMHVFTSSQSYKSFKSKEYFPNNPQVFVLLHQRSLGSRHTHLRGRGQNQHLGWQQSFHPGCQYLYGFDIACLCVYVCVVHSRQHGRKLFGYEIFINSGLSPLYQFQLQEKETYF